MNDNAKIDGLVAAIEELKSAITRQLEGRGKGIEPSDRLKEAFAKADAAVSAAQPHDFWEAK